MLTAVYDAICLLSVHNIFPGKLWFFILLGRWENVYELIFFFNIFYDAI